MHILQIGCTPVDEIDHIVPDFFKDQLEVESAHQLFVIAFSFNFVIDVDGLIDRALRYFKQLNGLITQESVQEPPARIPHFDVKVLLHEFEVTSLQGALELSFETLLPTTVKIIELVCEH